MEMEDLLPMSRRQMLFDSQGFDKPIEFDIGDIGVPGGLQVHSRIPQNQENLLLTLYSKNKTKAVLTIAASDGRVQLLCWLVDMKVATQYNSRRINFFIMIPAGYGECVERPRGPAVRARQNSQVPDPLFTDHRDFALLCCTFQLP